LSDSGRIIRLNRILRGNHHKALIVAFDHALVLGPIPGTEDPVGQIQRFAVGGADAILLNLGLLQNCIASLASAPLPGIIARLDWTTVWGAPGNSDDGELRSCLLARPADALRQGADAVLTYLVVGTGDTDFEAKEVERNAEVARECERIGMPLIVETLPAGNRWQIQGTQNGSTSIREWLWSWGPAWSKPIMRAIRKACGASPTAVPFR
jgi:fructose-bisphosphate aldolase, class I